MNQARFRQLIEGFCQLCGLPEPQRILDGGPVAVGDIAFSLVYNDEVKPDLVFIYCEFGEAPKGQEADAYRAVLGANMYLYDGSGPTFMISSETGRIVLADHRRLAGLEPAALREAMIAMSEHAKTWRVDYFLEKSRTRNPARRLHATQSNFLKMEPKA